MKKIVILGLLLFFTVPQIVSAQGISVTVDGKKQSYEQSPVLESGRTLVPLRGIFESLDASVTWDQKEKKILATKGNRKIELTINHKKAIVNGVSYDLDTPPKLINNHTMVPLRFVSEALGSDIDWNEQTKTIAIKKDGTRGQITPAKDDLSHIPGFAGDLSKIKPTREVIIVDGGCICNLPKAKP